MTGASPLVLRALEPAEVAEVRARRRPGPEGFADEVLELVWMGAQERPTPVSIEDTLDAVAAMSLDELLQALGELCPDEDPALAPLAQAQQVIQERRGDVLRRAASVGGRRHKGGSR